MNPSSALIRAAIAREATIPTFFTFPYRKVDLILLVFLFSSERATASESQNFSNLLRDISISLFPFQSHFRSVVAVHRAFFSSSSFFSFRLCSGLCGQLCGQLCSLRSDRRDGR